MSLWSAPKTVGVLLLVLLTTHTSGAQEESGETGRLEGIEVIDDVMTGGTIYFPRIETWPFPDIILNPALARHGPLSKQLFLRAILRGLGEGRLGVLTLAIDNSFVDLDLNLKGNVRVETSGCRPRTEVTVEDEDNLVRRISTATNVQVAYRAGEVSITYALMQEDLERFRRLVALYDVDDLPPLRKHPEKEFRDGQVLGSTARDISHPEIILSSKVLPQYPPEAVAKHKTGSVTLVARILKDGTVGTVRPLSIATADCGFAEAAIDAVKQWRYTPAKKNGQPIEVDFTIVTHFHLKK